MEGFTNSSLVTALLLVCNEYDLYDMNKVFVIIDFSFSNFYSFFEFLKSIFFHLFVYLSDWDFFPCSMQGKQLQSVRRACIGLG